MGMTPQLWKFLYYFYLTLVFFTGSLIQKRFLQYRGSILHNFLQIQKSLKGRVKKCLELSTLLLMKESDERMVMSLNFHKIPLSQYNGLILHLFYISDKHEQ